MLSHLSKVTATVLGKLSQPLVFLLSIILLSLSVALHFTQKGSPLEFFISLITIIPVSASIRFATKDITLRLQNTDHEFLAGLFNGIFGNCAELCFAITATLMGRPAVAQTTLTGSIISNCLMTFGTCLLLGGISHQHQSYPVIIARTNAQLLVVSLVSITLPTAFKTWSEDSATEDHSTSLAISHGSAIVLLLEFVSYIVFFYYTHTDVNENIPTRSWKEGLIAAGSLPAVIAYQNSSAHQSLKSLRAEALHIVARDSKPRYSVCVYIVVLIAGLAAQMFASLFVLEAIEAPSGSMHLSKSFVGLIIMPLVISSVDHITAALRSRKEGISWVTEVAFGSCIRISLFVFPLAVIIGWVTNIPDMNMISDGFQVTILALTILLVNHVIQNGVIHWLEGTMFISSFLLFAIAVWHYPNEA